MSFQQDAFEDQIIGKKSMINSPNGEKSDEKNAGIVSDYLPIINSIPPLLWVVVAGVALYLFGQPFVEQIRSGRVSKVGIGPVQIEMAKQSVLSIRDAAGIPKGPEFERIVARAQKMSCKLERSFILWVDDNHPSQNVAERRALESFGIHFDLANSTDEAMKWLDKVHYDAIISDLGREKESINNTPCFANSTTPAGSGCAFAKTVHDRYGEDAPPIILYSAGFPSEVGTPPYVFNVTDRVDRLFNLVFDAIDRQDCPLSNTTVP